MSYKEIPDTPAPHKRGKGYLFCVGFGRVKCQNYMFER